MVATGQGSDIIVREVDFADPVEAQHWDRFVTGHAEGTFFHLSGWRRVLEDGLGHRCHFLLAEQAGQVVGVLPATRIKSLLFGDRLVSTAFGVYGGALAQDQATRETLEARLVAIGEDVGVDYVEFRHRARLHPDWPAQEQLYVTFRKEMKETDADNLKAVPRKQRAMIRKGEQAGLVSKRDDSVDRLFELYAESVRNLGTPVFPRRYFQSLFEAFADQCEVCTIETADSQGISSVLSFFFKDEVLPYYGGGNDQARALKANDFMYWEVMRRARERGCRVFDYGRSKRDTGSYRFKKHWGFEPEPLYYEYHLVRAASMPDLNPLSPKYRYFVKVWQRLPLPLTKLAGPFLAKSLG